MRRACRLQPSRASSDAGNHSATTASAPRGARTHHSTGRTTAGRGVVRDHDFAIYSARAAVSITRLGGVGQERVVDKDWAGRLVTGHAAYPFASPAPPSPPVAWGEPGAYAKVTSRS